MRVTCHDAPAVELEARVYTLTDRMRDILERVSDYVRDLAGILRGAPGTRELAPEPVPVRADQ